MPHIAKKVISIGLDLEARNHQDMTPLLLQTFKAYLNKELIHVLLEASANPNASVSGWTALHG